MRWSLAIFILVLCLLVVVGGGTGAVVNWQLVCAKGWLHSLGWLYQEKGIISSEARNLFPIVVNEPDGLAFGFFLEVDIDHYVHPTRGPEANSKLVVSAPWYHSFDDMSKYIEWDELSEVEKSAVLEQVSVGTFIHKQIYGEVEFEFDGVSSFTSDPRACPVVIADLFRGGYFGAISGFAVWVLLFVTSFFMKWFVENRRRRLGKCERCAYPLVNGFCPECGSSAAE